MGMLDVYIYTDTPRWKCNKMYIFLGGFGILFICITYGIAAYGIAYIAYVGAKNWKD